MFSVDEIIKRACEKAIPRIQSEINKNIARKKHLKRVENRQKLRGK